MFPGESPRSQSNKITPPFGNQEQSPNMVVATVAVGSAPQGVAINPAGTHAYVANDVSNSVSVIGRATNMVVATVAVGANPRGVAL